MFSKLVQRGLNEHTEKMRQRRETVEHPFGTLKARMGATHFLMKTLPRVATEMALHVLAYNLTRVMNITGPGQERKLLVISQRFHTTRVNDRTRGVGPEGPLSAPAEIRRFGLGNDRNGA